MKTAWKLIGAIVAVAVIGVLATAIVMRTVDHDAETWHVDPLTAPAASSSNSFLVAPADANVDADLESPVFERSAVALAEDYDAVALDGGAEMIAGSPDDGFVTYVVTSRVFAFPDYVSVRFVEVDESTSTVAVLSRARFGQSDLGVNEDRITDWLEQLDR